MTDSVTSLFTFGYGQQCPYTGKDLDGHYALVTAPDRSSARLFMNTAFKRNYAFEYDGPGDTRIADYVPRMTLHITVNLVPEQPMPPGFDYSRADDGETTQPAAGRLPAHLEDGVTGQIIMLGGLPAVEMAGGLIEVDPPEGFVPASAPQVCLGRDMDCGRNLPCPDHPKCSPECDALTTRPEITGNARTWHHDECPVERDREMREEWASMVNAEREDDDR